jgi:DNA-binding transcriptional MerR regulator
MSTMLPRPGKGYYTESEAARILGVNVDNLRTLVRHHILPADPDAEANLPMTTFQPSDLLLLRFLRQTHDPAVAAVR